MLSWQRIALVAAVLAVAKGVMALVAADDPQAAIVNDAPPLLTPSEPAAPPPSSPNSAVPPGAPPGRTGLSSSALPPATNSARPRAPSADPPDSFTPSPEFQEWITNLVRQQLPENYEKRKNWGHTTKSFDGVSIKIED